MPGLILVPSELGTFALTFLAAIPVAALVLAVFTSKLMSQSALAKTEAETRRELLRATNRTFTQ